MRKVVLRLALVLPVLGLTASAGAACGSTFRSGVSSQLVDRPPYRAAAVPVPTGRVAHLPIACQAGAPHPEMFHLSDAPDSPVAGLLAEMHAYLDSMPRAGAGRPACTTSARSWRLVEPRPPWRVGAAIRELTGGVETLDVTRARIYSRNEPHRSNNLSRTPFPGSLFQAGRI